MDTVINVSHVSNIYFSYGKQGFLNLNIEDKNKKQFLHWFTSSSSRYIDVPNLN